MQIPVDYLLDDSLQAILILIQIHLQNSQRSENVRLKSENSQKVKKISTDKRKLEFLKKSNQNPPKYAMDGILANNNMGNGIGL